MALPEPRDWVWNTITCTWVDGLHKAGWVYRWDDDHWSCAPAPSAPPSMAMPSEPPTYLVSEMPSLPVATAPGSPGASLALAKAHAVAAQAEYQWLQALAQDQTTNAESAMAADLAAAQEAAKPQPAILAVAHSAVWSPDQRSMFLGSLPGLTTIKDIEDVCNTCGVRLERTSMNPPGNSGLLSAKLIVGNPPRNMRTLMMELHGHLSGAQKCQALMLSTGCVWRMCAWHMCACVNMCAWFPQNDNKQLSH